MLSKVVEAPNLREQTVLFLEVFCVCFFLLCFKVEERGGEGKGGKERARGREETSRLDPSTPVMPSSCHCRSVSGVSSLQAAAPIPEAENSTFHECFETSLKGRAQTLSRTPTK